MVIVFLVDIPLFKCADIFYYVAEVKMLGDDPSAEINEVRKRVLKTRLAYTMGIAIKEGEFMQLSWCRS